MGGFKQVSTGEKTNPGRWSVLTYTVANQLVWAFERAENSWLLISILCALALLRGKDPAIIYGSENVYWMISRSI